MEIAESMGNVKIGTAYARLTSFIKTAQFGRAFVLVVGHLIVMCMSVVRRVAASIEFKN